MVKIYPHALEKRHFAYPQSYAGALWVQRSQSGVLDVAVFTSPLANNSSPAATIPLTTAPGFTGYPVLGCPGSPGCTCGGSGCSGGQMYASNADGLDFAPSAGGDEVWVADRWNNRVFRIANRLGLRNSNRGPFVDVVLGQPNLAGTACVAPTASSLCYQYDVTLDARGDLYIADNGGEAGSNSRILEFDANRVAVAATATRAKFGLAASRVLGTGGDFNASGPSAASDPLISPFKPVFHQRGYMTVGNNPYMTQRFPVVYLNPLAEQLPQMILGDFLSYPAGSSYVDPQGNLYVTDTNWSRVLIYKQPFAQLDFGGGPLFSCTSGLLIDNPRLRVSKNLAPPGDEKLRMSGRLQFAALAPPLDPIANGFSFSVTDPNGTAVFERVVPPGLAATRGAPGWRRNRTGTRWTFTDGSGTLASGITRVVISTFPQRAPGRVTFAVRGSRANFQVRPDQIPVQMQVVLGAPAQATLGQCGGRTFNPPGSATPKCTLSRTGATLTCR